MKSRLSGCAIEFNPSFSLKLKEEIGSGSFSHVYSTSDPQYVIKMINASDPKSLGSYHNEKFAFQSIPRHQNIVHCPAYKDSIFFKNVNFCCLALENCSKGSVISMMVDKKVVFQEHQIFRIIFEVVTAVHQLHTLRRPIIHRDLKGENILLGNDGSFKLTDFGSITTKRIQEVTSDNRDDIQEDLDKNTTPTIRAPEQCDLYTGAPINEKVDIWAIGCLLYILCFQKQPFESKLATVNCQYFMPDRTNYSETLLNLFPLIFNVNPRDRPSTLELLAYFDTNTKSSLKAFTGSIEETNSALRRDDSYSNSSFQQSSSGVSKSSKRDKQLQSLKIQHSTSDDAKVKPLLADVVQKYIAKISTKTEAWMLTALEENQKGPSQTSVQLLIVKAWQKPQKIKKFYSLLHKKYTRNPESTIITLKALITLHTYFRKGPNQVYTTRESPSARDILHSINQSWRIVFERDSPSVKDMARSTYTSQLILEYSELLLRKYHLQLKYTRTFQGNYALEPFFLMPVEENSPILASVIEDLLRFLDILTNFHKMLFLGKNIWRIQCSIAASILDDEYCLISVLAHLIATFKHATNYISVKNKQEVIETTVKKFEEAFAYNYEKAGSFFESCRNIREFNEYRSLIPNLKSEVLREIQSVPILKNYKNERFYVVKYLNNQRTICNLTVPLSYNQAAKNINLGVTNIDERRLSHYSSVQSTYDHDHGDVSSIHQKREVPSLQVNSKAITLEESRHLAPQRIRPHRRSVSGQKPDVHSKSLQQDFNPNFDDFNSRKTEPAEEIVKEGRKSKDMYAGFNFNVPPQGSLNSQLINNLLLDLKQTNELENEPEDLMLAFSHQKLNTSFFQPTDNSRRNSQLTALVDGDPNTKNIQLLDPNKLQKRPSITKSQSDRPNAQKEEQELSNTQYLQNFFQPEINPINKTQQNLLDPEPKAQNANDLNPFVDNLMHTAANPRKEIDIMNLENPQNLQVNAHPQQPMNQNVIGFQQIPQQRPVNLSPRPQQSPNMQFAQQMQANQNPHIDQYPKFSTTGAPFPNMHNQNQLNFNMNNNLNNSFDQGLRPAPNSNQNFNYGLMNSMNPNNVPSPQTPQMQNLMNQPQMMSGNPQMQNVMNQPHMMSGNPQMNFNPNMMMQQNQLNSNGTSFQGTMHQLLPLPSQRMMQNGPQQFNQNPMNMNGPMLPNGQFNQFNQPLNNINQPQFVHPQFMSSQNQPQINMHHQQLQNQQFNSNLNQQQQQQMQFLPQQNQNQNQNQHPSSPRPGSPPIIRQPLPNQNINSNAIQRQNMNQIQENQHNNMQAVKASSADQGQNPINQQDIGEINLLASVDITLLKKQAANMNQPQGNITNNNQIYRQEESKQEPNLLETANFKEWDGVFNIDKNVEAKKHIELEKEKRMREEEAKRKKNTPLSLVNTPLTSSHLRNFIFQEVSKNVADWIIDYKQLKFLSQIGSGGSAEVFRGVWRGSDVAIKKMRLNNLPENRKKEFEREISALMKLRPQQNLVNFMGVSVTDSELCIVMEFLTGGTLFEWLHVKKNFPITWRQRLKMATDVACGMNYLHTSNPPIMHRDLKSLNLLVDAPLEKDSKRFNIKIADFGLAKPQELAQEKMTGVMGTYHWMAPEIFENKDYSIKADVYSFSVVLWEILTRETPYPEIKNPAAIMKYVTMDKGRPDLSKVPNHCPMQLIELMIQCWDEDPDRRPHFSEVLERLKDLENWQPNQK